MNETKSVNSWVQTCTGYGKGLAENSDDGKPVLQPVIAPEPVNMPARDVLASSLQIYGHAEMMPEYRLLDHPGVSPYGEMEPEEAAVMKAIENLFYDSVSIVLTAGDQVTQTIATALKVKKNEIKENMKAQLKEIEKKYAALRKKAKMGLLGKICNWLAVAVTAVVCASATVITGGAAAGVTAAVFALTLAVTILDETGKTEKLISGVADMLKSFGVDEKYADLIAGIAVSVTIAVVLITATICLPGAGSGEVVKAGTAMRRAAQITMRASETMGAGVTTLEGSTGIAQGLYKRDEFLSKARLKEINAKMKYFENQIQQLFDDMKECHERSEETKQLLTQSIQDVAQTVIQLINDAMGLRGSSPSSA